MKNIEADIYRDIAPPLCSVKLTADWSTSSISSLKSTSSRSAEDNHTTLKIITKVLLFGNQILVSVETCVSD